MPGLPVGVDPENMAGNKPDPVRVAGYTHHSFAAMDSVHPVPAATVVPLRDAPGGGLEVLLLRRNAALDFVGGVWVFPGGRIDAQDHRGAACEADAARVAACREAMEEAAVALRPADLVPFSHWTTPSPQPKRFATWFFLADASEATAICVDDSEIVDYCWLPVRQAVAQASAATLPMVRPTVTTLRRLSRHTGVRQALRGGPFYDPTPDR